MINSDASLVDFSGYALSESRDVSSEVRAVAGAERQELGHQRDPHFPPKQQSVVEVTKDSLPRVRLTGLEVVLTEGHAVSLANNHPSGVEPSHRIGLQGESAVAKHYGQEQKLDVNIYEGRGDGGFDLLLAGYQIDVKTTRKNPLKLEVRAAEPWADIYFLVQQESEQYYRLIGYAYAEVVKQAPIEKKYGERKHIVPDRYLWPAPEDEQEIG